MTTLHTAAGTPLRLLDVRDAAAYCGLTTKAMRRRIERFRRDPVAYYLPVRTVGRSLRFLPAELDAWMVGERRARVRAA